MKKTGFLGGIAIAIVVATAAVVVVARAQARVFPEPSEITPAGMTTQTSEPMTGFTGACLADVRAYAPALPLICYVPGSSAQYGAGSTTISFPAKAVYRSYSMLASSYDSYQALMTCYPHTSNGQCPQSSFAISRSCCDYGATLTSVDGQTASGLASFR